MTTSLDWSPIPGSDTLQATANDGAWRIKAPLMGNPAHVSFNLSDGRDYLEIRAALDAEQPPKGSDAYWRYRSLLEMSSRDHSYAETQEDAVALVDLLLNADVAGSGPELLLLAGFQYQYQVGTGWSGAPLNVYRKKVGRGHFAVYRCDNYIHLTFQKDGWLHHENLAQFTLWTRTERNGVEKHFWPERVMAHFPVLTVRACLFMIDRYIRDGRHLRRKRR